MLKFFTAISLMLLISLGACAPTQSRNAVVQPIGKTLTTHVGGKVLTIRKQRDLPNAFGNADIFGRKVDAGSTELTFSGLNKKGHAVFQVSDVNIYSDETTMSRSGMSFTNATLTGYGNNSVGLQSTTTRAPQASRYAAAPSGSSFTVDLKKTSVVEFGEYVIDIESASPTSISYRIDDGSISKK
jgi:hypothetical protein